MADFTSVEQMLEAFYRLLGTTSSDEALTEQGEATNEVGFLMLTRGIRSAQEFLTACGLSDYWHARSSAITSWSGADSTDGGRYTSLPSDFMRLWGDGDLSALREADGKPWGRELPARFRFDKRGDWYYLLGDQLWIAKGANPPGTLYLHYVQYHAEITATNTSLDFPTPMRGLAVAFAADEAKNEAWAPGGPEMVAKIAANLRDQKQKAQRWARRSREPKKAHALPMQGRFFVR